MITSDKLTHKSGNYKIIENSLIVTFDRDITTDIFKSTIILYLQKKIRLYSPSTYSNKDILLTVITPEKTSILFPNAYASSGGTIGQVSSYQAPTIRANGTSYSAYNLSGGYTATLWGDVSSNLWYVCNITRCEGSL